MPSERRRQRSFDIAPGELVQFVGLPGVRPATGLERSGRGGPGGHPWDFFHTGEGQVWVSSILPTEEVLAALAPPAPRPDYLELRPAAGQAFEVTIPGAGLAGLRPERVFVIEPTEFGLRQLAGLVAAQSAQRQTAAKPLAPWVPSEWSRVFQEGPEGRKEYVGKVKRFTEAGRQEPVVAGEDWGL